MISHTKILRFIIITVLILPFTTFAQTEVSGEVSGEWTAEDSPYIVTDSTWIPEDEELRIGPGVDVLFGEGLGLVVFGTLTAEGSEEDSVRFMPQEEDIQWDYIWARVQNAEVRVQTLLMSSKCLVDSLTSFGD